MANTLRFKRGLVAGIPTAALGEPLFTTDTFDLYIGNGTGNTRFQKYIASGTTGQLLRGDGSLLTMPIVLTSPANGQVLKYDGTNWVNSADAGVTGSGTAGQVTYWGSSSTITGSNNLFWDATNNRLGIGTNAPTSRLHVTSTAWNSTEPFVSFINLDPQGVESKGLYVQAGANTSGSYIANFANYSGTSVFYLDGLGNLGLKTTSPTHTLDVADSARFRNQIRFATDLWNVSHTDSANRLFFSASGSTFFGTASGYNWQNSGGSNIMSLFGTGNLHVGGTTDNGLRFQVTGDGFFSGSVGVGTSSLTSYGLRVNKTIVGALSSTGIYQDGTVQSTVTSNVFGIYNSARTQAAAFTLTNYYHYYADQFALGAGSSITNQFGYVADSTLTGATNNFGFYGNIASGTGRWNLYMNGSAANYLAGSLGIGTTSFTGYSLRVNKIITGATTSYGVSSDGIIQSDVTGQAFGFNTSLGTQAASFTLPVLSHYRADQSTFGAGSAVTTQYGFQVRSNLTGATNNYGFFGDLAAATGRWNLYMNGTAANYLAGNLWIGTTSGNHPLEVASAGNTILYIRAGATSLSRLVFGTSTNTDRGFIDYDNTAASRNMSFKIAETERMRLDASGNLGLGVTPSAWSVLRGLQVGLTASVSGYAASTEGAFFASNSFYDGGAFKYQVTGNATSYLQISGTHRWSYAASGTAGNNITFTEAMRLDASGNLLLGSTSSSGERLQVTGTAKISGEFRVAAAINSTQATFANTTGRGLAISTAVVGGTNEAAVVLNARSSVTSGTFIFQTDGTQRMQLDVNGLEFPNNKGLLFDNASASAVGSIKMGTGVTNPLEITNGTHTVTLATLGTFISSNLLVGASTIGTSATNTIAVVNGTAPSSSATDIFHLYSADVTAGNAAPHFRTENGAVIKLYQETTAVGNSIISLGGGNAVLDDTTFDGYTLRQIVKALRNQGILQ